MPRCGGLGYQVKRDKRRSSPAKDLAKLHATSLPCLIGDSCSQFVIEQWVRGASQASARTVRQDVEHHVQAAPNYLRLNLQAGLSDRNVRQWALVRSKVLFCRDEVRRIIGAAGRLYCAVRARPRSAFVTSAVADVLGSARSFRQWAATMPGCPGRSGESRSLRAAERSGRRWLTAFTRRWRGSGRLFAGRRG
jgi:hypothetical protein